MSQIKPPKFKFVLSPFMYRIIILLNLFLQTLSATAQYQFRRVASMPSDLSELSGLQSFKGQIFAHNDGGNLAELFGIDTFGNILWKKMLRANNIDWEDIALKPDSFIFMADFGNNDNTRKDLKVYKVGLTAFGNDTLDTEVISFYYSEQNTFPPAGSNLYYDCEALIYFDDSLHLFTKNRTSPFDGWVKHYSVPAVSGNYQAYLKDSFQIGGTIKELCWITGADISPDGKKLALQGSDKVFMFSNFSGSNFLRGHAETFALGDISQKEAITFINDSLLLIGDEAYINPAGLYLLSLTKATVSEKPNPEPKQLEFVFDNSTETLKFNSNKSGQLCIFDQSGKIIIRKAVSPDGELSVNTQSWSIGAYRCVLLTRNEKFQGVFLKF